MAVKEDTHAYAQRRANETGKPYAVWMSDERPDLVYAAWYCAFNRRAYADCGASVIAVYRPRRRCVAALTPGQ